MGLGGSQCDLQVIRAVELPQNHRVVYAPWTTSPPPDSIGLEGVDENNGKREGVVQ